MVAAAPSSQADHTNTGMNPLAAVLIFKIAATVLVWCVPLLLLPAATLTALGFPAQDSFMFVRMLGWAYLALCVGYSFSLAAAWRGRRMMGPIWVGLVSNGGACLYLLFYGATGTWVDWGGFVQFIAWSSALATALITLGLFVFGVRGRLPLA